MAQNQPKQYFISEYNSHLDLPPLKTNFNPNDICEQPNLILTSINLNNDELATRHVQTDPEVKNRFIYQCAEVTLKNLKNKFKLSFPEKLRKKVLELGENGDHAGHVLGNRFSGEGVLNNGFPQNAVINQVNWKVMEKVIYVTMEKLLNEKNNFVKYSHLAVYDDKQKEKKTRPKEILFKLENEKKELIIYGKLDNPSNVKNKEYFTNLSTNNKTFQKVSIYF